MEIKTLYPVIFGGLIGYVTNWVAIKLLFWPKKPIWFLQGAVPKNKVSIAKNIAVTSTEHLFSADEIASVINQKLTPEKFKQILLDLLPGLAANIDSEATKEEIRKIITAKLREMPGMDSSIAGGIARGAVQSIVVTDIVEKNKEHLVSFLTDKIYPVIADRATDIIKTTISAEEIQNIIIKNVMAMDEDEIERTIRSVSNRELTLIEWSGGVLGVLIGFIQMLF